LTEEQLAPVVSEAISRWSVVSAVDVSALTAMPFEIVDLPGSTLGRVAENAVLIDPTAAGYGWFVDDTPEDDSEFARTHYPLQLVADTESPAFGRVDLLTVVLHEAGHVLGLDHASESYDVMASVLPDAVRRLPSDTAGLNHEASSLDVGVSREARTALVGLPSGIASGSVTGDRARIAAAISSIFGSPHAAASHIVRIDTDTRFSPHAIAKGHHDREARAVDVVFDAVETERNDLEPEFDLLPPTDGREDEALSAVDSVLVEFGGDFSQEEPVEKFLWPLDDSDLKPDYRGGTHM
jgi:hypothetical protein